MGLRYLGGKILDTPKISVLIPMYNRKHYIKDCVDSVLNQTFKDFEIIIRDNCSTDGGFEFVQENYANQISSGKIKLFRNDENIGLWRSSNRLMYDAKGEYVYFLHSDDIFLSHALKHLYEAAKATNADVVHESYWFNIPQNSVGQSVSNVDLRCLETNPAPKDTLIFVSNNPINRFSEWITSGTFWDVQYNLLKREFILEELFAREIFFKVDYKFFMLWLLMFSKVFVKTPVICYVRRAAPDSGTNTGNWFQKIDESIKDLIEISRSMDEVFDKIAFFKDNEEYQYMAKAHLLQLIHPFFVTRRNFYKDGITPEIQRTVANAFKEYFGKDYFYVEFLFNLSQVSQHGKPVDKIVTPSAPPRFTEQLILEAA